MEYRSISNKDKGHSVRGKINTMFSSLINGSEGVLAIWRKLFGLDETIRNIESTVQTNYDDLRKSVTQSYDYTDRQCAQLRVSFEDATLRNKGYFPTIEALNAKIPFSEEGCIAYVGTEYPYSIYRWQNSAWVDTSKTGGDETVRLAYYYTKDEIDLMNGENSVTTEKISPSAVTADKIAPEAINSSKLAAASVTVEKIAEGAVNSTHLAEASVGANHLRTESVTEEAIAYGAVTTDKIAEGSITPDKLPDASVGIVKFPDSTKRLLLHDFSLGRDNTVYAYTSEQNVDGMEPLPFTRILNPVELQITVSAEPIPESVTGEIVFLEGLGIFAYYVFMDPTNEELNTAYRIFENSEQYVEGNVFVETTTDTHYQLSFGELVPVVAGRRVPVVALGDLQKDRGIFRFSRLVDLSQQEGWTIDEDTVASPMQDYLIVFDTNSARFMYSGPWLRGVPSAQLVSYPKFSLDEFGVDSKAYAFNQYVQKEYLADNNTYYRWRADGRSLKQVSNIQATVTITSEEYDAMVQAGTIDNDTLYFIFE